MAEENVFERFSSDGKAKKKNRRKLFEKYYKTDRNYSTITKLNTFIRFAAADFML